MPARTLLICLAALLPVGCAAPPAPVMGIGGPADPRAAETPVPPRSQTLDPSGTATTRPAEPDAGPQNPGSQHQNKGTEP